MLHSNISDTYKNNINLINNINLDLSDNHIIDNCEILSLESHITNSIISFKDDLLKNEDGILLLKTYLGVFFSDDKGNLDGYVDFSHIFPNNSDLFFLLVAVLKIDSLYDFYKDKKIPDDILIDTLGDVKVWVNNHFNKTGRHGLGDLNWLYFHLRGDLFRIGRLQFMKVPFKGDVRVYKQLVTDFPLILSCGNLKYDFPGNKIDEKECFLSTYIESNLTVTANPIREGKCLKDPMTINKCDYSLEIQHDSILLDMHIPQGDKLNIPLCIDSMKKAIIFYYKHFNSQIIKGFTCKSWLLNQNFKYILDESSNISKFASMFYVYPSVSTDKQMYARVFNGETDINNLEKLPNKTKLQEAIIKGINDGLTFEDTSVVFLSKDIKKLQRFML
ncbi:MAG: acyltransferase domain-containing protein [Clostridium sp.]